MNSEAHPTIHSQVGFSRSQDWPEVPEVLAQKGCLVGGIPTPPKNMKVSWEGLSQYIMEKIMNSEGN